MTGQVTSSDTAPTGRGPVWAVKSGFLRYFEFSGTSTRPEFWWWAAFAYLAGWGLSSLEPLVPVKIRGIIPSFQITSAPDGVNFSVLLGGGVIASLFFLVVITPTLAVGFRRCRDAGAPGWLFLLPIATIFLLVVLFYVAFSLGAPMGSRTVAMIGIVAYSGAMLSWLFILLSKSKVAAGPAEMVQT